MTSKKAADTAYVWIWLPKSTKPVVAGKLMQLDNQYVFNYWHYAR